MSTTYDHTIRWINEGRMEVKHTSIQNEKKYTEQGFIQFSNNLSFEMQLITKLGSE